MQAHQSEKTRTFSLSILLKFFLWVGLLVFSIPTLSLWAGAPFSLGQFLTGAVILGGIIAGSFAWVGFRFLSPFHMKSVHVSRRRGSSSERKRQGVTVQNDLNPGAGPGMILLEIIAFAFMSLTYTIMNYMPFFVVSMVTVSLLGTLIAFHHSEIAQFIRKKSKKLMKKIKERKSTSRPDSQNLIKTFIKPHLESNRDNSQNKMKREESIASQDSDTREETVTIIESPREKTNNRSLTSKNNEVYFIKKRSLSSSDSNFWKSSQHKIDQLNVISANNGDNKKNALQCDPNDIQVFDEDIPDRISYTDVHTVYSEYSNNPSQD